MRTIGRMMSCFLFGTFLSFAAFAQTAPPPMSTLPDILNGERQVLPVHDILVAQTYYMAGAYRDVELGLTSNSAISQFVRAGLSSNYLAAYSSYVAPELIATGRLFNTNVDVGVTFTLSDNGNSGTFPHLETTLLTKTAGSTLILPQAAVQTIPMAALRPLAVVVADFTGDGFDDVAFLAGTSDAPNHIIIGTAVDINDPRRGLRFGPDVPVPVGLDMKAGDLNGDGRAELVLLFHDLPFATNLYAGVYPVDRTSLNLVPMGSYQVTPWKAADKYRLAVGKFDDDMGDAEIVVVQGGGTCTSGTTAYCGVYVRPLNVTVGPTGQYSFAPASVVDIGASLNGSTGKPWDQLVGLEVATGKLNWFGGNTRDQLVVGAGMSSSSSSNYRGYAAVVLNFATNAMSISADQVKASAYTNAAAPTTCLNGVAIGRFSPPSPDADGTPTNSQVALLLGVLSSGDSQQTDCSPDAWNTVQYTSLSVGTYTVDPANNYKITSASSKPLPPESRIFAPPRMAVGDFQGRSLLLGAPTIISVAQQIQPQIVIDAPPMHLDYFVDAAEREECYAPAAQVRGYEPSSWSGSGTAAAGCIRNVSAYPGHTTGATACDYCAKYQTSSEATKAGTQKTTTSHTWSNEGGGSLSIKFGTLTPNLLQNKGFQAELHGSAKQTNSTTNSTTNSYMAKEAVSLATSTGPDDYVMYTVQDIYLYNYPVIGQTDDNGNPLYLRFSVPDKTEYLEAEASSLQWWQPPHEVGNIFSYPGNADQLLADHPGAADRSGPFTWTSQTQKTQTVTWTQGQTTEKSAGSVDKLEWNVGASVSGAIKIRKTPITVSGNAKYDHNESTSNDYLNTNTMSLSASSGFTISTEIFTAVPGSNYSSEARILGAETPTAEEGYWDDEVPMPDPKGEAGEGFVPDLKLDGPMELVYMTNMLPGNGYTPGYLWNAEYGSAPDIALQHPKRFLYKGRSSATIMSDWWSFNPLYSDTTLSNMYSAEFLKMKGFFINPATAAAGDGPQMTTAEDGTKLRLEARIYNYSLKGLPPGASVKVRFYGHRLADDGNTWVPGECFMIGEDSVPIEGFRSDPLATVATNRAMAETIFDTTGRSGQYIVFWVVAWAEDAGGNLVPELAQHGLRAKPPAACTQNSILDMPMEFYSNNVGFYDQPFYILPKAVAAAPMPAAAPLQPFSIGTLSVSPVRAERPYAGELWVMEAPLNAGGQDAEGVHLLHAGAGPGGRVSNTELIPFIAAGQTYTDRLTFRPLWCGPHAAVVGARPAFQERTSATLRFDIPCRPEDVTAYFNDVLTDASLAGAVEVNANGQVKGRLAALQRAVLSAEQLAEMGAVKGACQQYSQAIDRVVDAGDGPVARLLEDIIRNAQEQLGCR